MPGAVIGDVAGSAYRKQNVKSKEFLLFTPNYMADTNTCCRCENV